MRRFNGAYIMLFIIPFFILAGCSFNKEPLRIEEEVVHKSPKFIENKSNLVAAHIKDMSLRMEVVVPQKVIEGEPFELTGLLWNETADPLSLQHGADLFTYKIYNDNGEEVSAELSERMMTSIGYGVVINPLKQYSFNEGEHVSPPFNVYTLQASGPYTVVGTARFELEKEGQDTTSVTIVSDPVSFMVYSE